MFINAAQAMLDGGVLRILTGLDESGTMVEITVADSGQGIEKNDLNKVFDPFFSTKVREGSGLGLSITYGIINNHAGQISVQSEVDQGTVFTIRLPIGDSVAQTITAAGGPCSAPGDGSANYPAV